MDRASSEPPQLHGAPGINPFSSDRNQKEVQLLAARPRELPRMEQSPEAGVLPVRDGCTGKGRGNQSLGKVACFEAPPSRTLNGGDDGAENRVAKVKQSEGRMPDDRDGSRMSMGRVSMEVTMDDVSKPSVDGLQRALEVEVVNQLRVQNSQLMEEVEKLKAMMSQSGKGSSGSWSDLGGSACAGVPPEADDGGRRHGGYHTPRSAARTFGPGKRDVRLTPNGTRVPDGTPPSSETPHAEPCHAPQPPPARPVVPPFPQSFMVNDNMEQFLEGYEKVESKPKVMKTDPTWEPKRR